MVVAPLAVVEVSAVFAFPRTITGFEAALFLISGFFGAGFFATVFVDFFTADFEVLFFAALLDFATFFAGLLATFFLAGFAADFDFGFFAGTGRG